MMKLKNNQIYKLFKKKQNPNLLDKKIELRKKITIKK